MKNPFLKIAAVAATLLSAVIFTGCASNTNLKTPHVYQASGKGIKFGLVQDPVTGQYSFGFQSLYAGGMVVPINVAVGTNGEVNAVVPDAVMSYEIGGKGTFFGSADSTVTFAVGPNAVQTIPGRSASTCESGLLDQFRHRPEQLIADHLHNRANRHIHNCDWNEQRQYDDANRHHSKCEQVI